MAVAGTSWVERLKGVGRRRPLLVDALVAASVVGLAGIHAAAEKDSDVLSLVFAVALAVPLLWRRRSPVGVMVVLAVVALGQWALDVRSFGDLALLVALYTVAVSREPARALAALAVVEVGALMASVRWAPHEEVKVFVGLSGLAIAATVLGTASRQRRSLLATLQDRAARLEVERDQQGRLSAAAERARIAREMHDIVAHNLSVMIALADGADFALDGHPDQARDAMRRTSSTGRQALTEMRRLLGVLREDDAEDPRLVPQPGLEEIDGLVQQVRATGLPVTYAVAGRPGVALAPGLQLTAFRIVQEALTNTLKHAGDAATAQIRLDHGADDLVVEVFDTGSTARGARREGSGLRGMRERVAVYDGVLDAGPADGGGWRIHARLPIAPGVATPVAV